MDLRRLKMRAFTSGSLAGLVTLVNDYTAGKASGGYPAGDVAEKKLVDQQYILDAGTYTVVLFYSD